MSKPLVVILFLIGLVTPWPIVMFLTGIPVLYLLSMLVWGRFRFGFVFVVAREMLRSVVRYSGPIWVANGLTMAYAFWMSGALPIGVPEAMTLVATAVEWLT